MVDVDILRPLPNRYRGDFLFPCFACQLTYENFEPRTSGALNPI